MDSELEEVLEGQTERVNVPELSLTLDGLK